MDIQMKRIVKHMNQDFRLEVDDLLIPHGTIAAVVGNNGAGKTTLLSVIAGLRSVAGGTLTLNSIPLSNQTREWWKSHLGVYLDETFLFDYCTVMEHFRFLQSGWGIPEAEFQERLQEYEPTFSLQEYYHRRISSLSGTKKKTGLMGTLLIRPDILVWDEPFNGLDPRSQEGIKQVIGALNTHHGITFLIGSHHLVQVAEVCNQVVILKHGRIEYNLCDRVPHERLKDLMLESTNSKSNTVAAESKVN